ncbi:hypothetical protein CLV24_108124 [Pontibacter ummariensis]|uniref:SpoIIAA-like n=1 Tax=Pontibacter ummariensis TaxID=1610492 RepID=A0A239F842_9BACT|nr:hypothetical protein [Pontibacter ummariensis]PRY12380.1 hypothetical protein CLV24_108124 [Pontibacter ummariensis]SNS53056.1 hypothetical protein SAMN06296052_10861 [Pontibacter ummariensis]
MRKNLFLDAALEAGGDAKDALIHDKLNVHYDQEQEILVVTWTGKVSSEELRKGYDLVMEQVMTHKPRKWLLDLQERDKVNREDQRWVFQHVFPNVLRVVGNDVFVAVILPVSLYPGIVKDLEGDELMCGGYFLIMDHFLYPEEAHRWLNGMLLTSSRA